MVVDSKKDTPTHFIVHKIDADEGEVTLQQKSDKRKRISVSLQHFIDTYIPVDEKKLVTAIV